MSIGGYGENAEANNVCKIAPGLKELKRKAYRSNNLAFVLSDKIFQLLVISLAGNAQSSHSTWLMAPYKAVLGGDWYIQLLENAVLGPPL